MGERKGQNHYYPPDFNYKVHKTLNRYHGFEFNRQFINGHAFKGFMRCANEMPFNVWCLGCNNHIGMSVRYNAEKKKVGMYYTTPIYEFRMKCHLCDNYFTIRTDPKNFDYEMVEGLRRQEIRFDPATIDNLAPVDRTMNLKLAADAMFKSEHMVEDKQKLAGSDQQIQKLEEIQTRLFDDYRANQVLRGAFRLEKKQLNEQRARDADLRARLSSEIVLLPERKEDQLAAKRLALSKHMLTGKEGQPALTREKLMSSSIFELPNTSKHEDSKQFLTRKVRENVISAIGITKISGDGLSRIRRTSLGICVKNSHDDLDQKVNSKNKPTDDGDQDEMKYSSKRRDEKFGKDDSSLGIVSAAYNSSGESDQD